MTSGSPWMWSYAPYITQANRPQKDRTPTRIKASRARIHPARYFPLSFLCFNCFYPLASSSWADKVSQRS